jgi:GPH family glycoside/pentoside/hexuronide:cation symporter
MVFLGWGLGSFTTSVLINSIGLLQLRFMTDSLGIGAAMAGTLIAISKIYDAATDAVMGVISDQTRSRWGRHRPYLFAGTILCAISLVMLFNVPAEATGGWIIAYVAGVLLLFSTAYTMFRVPYLAMGAEITRGFRQRSILMTFSVYGSSIGGLFATSAAPFLLSRIGSDRAGHGIVACILAALILLGGLACFWAIGRATVTAPPVSRHRIGLTERLQALRENKPFAVLIGFKMLMFTAISLHGTAVPFYTRHVLKVSDASIAGIYLGQTLATMASQIGWVRLARRFGRRNALIGAALLDALVMMGWTLVPMSAPTPWIQILGVCQGICTGGLFFGLYTILPDTMEYDRHRSGIERAGIFAGIFVMVEKITSAVGAAVFGGVLGAVGYVAAKDSSAAVQPAGVLDGIIFILAVLPSIASLLACLVLRLYDLDETRVTTGMASGATSPA